MSRHDGDRLDDITAALNAIRSHVQRYGVGTGREAEEDAGREGHTGSVLKVVKVRVRG